MSSLFKLAGLTAEMEPAITKWSFEDMGDEPDKHRWRAWWVTESLRSGPIVAGIELRAYPVIKTNPESVWIDEWADRQATKQPWEDGAPGREWVAYEGKPVKKRLLHNGSGSAWAKPTQEEAIHSLAVRLTRWSSILAREVQKVRSAADALEKLRPNHDWAAGHVRDALRFPETKEIDT